MKKNLNIILLWMAILMLNLQSNNLYGQDPELFNHTWYLEKIVIDNEEFLVSDLTGNPYYNFIINEMYFENFNGEDYMTLAFCNVWDGKSEIFTDTLHFDYFEPSPIDFCDITPGEGGDLILDYEEKYISVYVHTDSGIYIPKNPFTYIIQNVAGNHYQLTIENGEGDWAVYNSVLLSIPSFNQNSFTLYPNPVKEVLNITTRFPEAFTVSIYDMTGKLLKSQVFDAAQNQMDVKQLNSGLYFAVFESETGEQVSKKFVKK